MFKKTILLATALLLTQTAFAQTAPTTPKLANQTMNTPRPLFFQDIAALDTTLHRKLTLSAQRKNFAFAAQANLLPLTFAEVGQALHSFPIVFVAEGNTVALFALTDLQPGNNRFVNANGEWRAGAYIPAYVRGYAIFAKSVRWRIHQKCCEFVGPPVIAASRLETERAIQLIVNDGQYTVTTQKDNDPSVSILWNVFDDVNENVARRQHLEKTFTFLLLEQ
jgi:hypothetical protein